MKKCPSCGYGNPDTGAKCGICSKDITAVRIKSDPVQEKESGRPSLMVLSGLLLLLCGAVVFFMENSPWKKEAPLQSGEDAFTDENSFTYEGVLYGLDKMAAMRFLPEADKRRVLPLLSSPEDKVAYAAAKLLGEWSRSDTDAALRRLWFEALLGAVSTGRPVVRRQAALEAGFAAAFGFPVQPYLERVRQAAAGLAAQKEPELKAAGFFLSSMAGLEDLSGLMSETLLSDPSTSAKLYAACSLSRLGHAEGHAYILQAAAGKDPDLRSEALFCLSYSASPEAGRLLLSASKDSFDAASAEAAKRGIKLREQLAIIKK
ncbi:MAG: HEAT repeat domain-containing protein [Elusimicrobiales bacterium]|nr:HEAT repeat domain-containing protein [Elusimicrobiales bacterium]